jgi:oligoribonuclease
LNSFELEAYFHYRNLDVSTLKELCKRWKPELASGFKKHQKHTALADILESIEETRIDFFMIFPTGNTTG